MSAALNTKQSARPLAIVRPHLLDAAAFTARIMRGAQQPGRYTRCVLAADGLTRVLCLLLLLLTTCVTGCSKAPYVWASQVSAERAAPREDFKTIRSGDIVAVAVVGQPLMSAEHTVGADGTIALPNVGSVYLGGKSRPEAEKELQAKFAQILESPRVSLVIVSRHIEVSVLGEVRSPGKYQLKSGDGVATAIAISGGITEFGNDNSVYLVREDEPMRIRFRMKDLVRGGKSARAFALRDGDLLVVE